MSPPGAEPRLHRNVWAASAASFLTDVSSETIFNLLPLFLANVLGVKTGVIGLIEGLAESLSSFFKLLSGVVSDRFRKRKGLAVLGYALSTAAKPFLYVAGSWSAVLAVRAVDRLGKGIRTAPRDALLAASVSPETRGLAFGLHRAADTAGAFVGILLAGTVVWFTQRGGLALEAATFRDLVLVALVPAVLGVVVLAVGAQEIGGGAPRPTTLRLSLTGFDRRFHLFLVAALLFTLGNSADAFLVLRAQERGLGVLGILGMLASFNFVYAALAAPAGKLSDRIGRKTMLLAGWAVYAVIYLGFAAAEGARSIVVLYTLYGVYYAATEGIARAFVADLVPEARRGAAFGLYHAVVGAAALPASVFAGLLWQGAGSFAGLGPRAPFVFGAGLALAATVVLASIPRPAPVLSSSASKMHPPGDTR